ncbi:MAG: hypothetical protein H7222_01030 [Methylotenera sp.]|nr:hypothetical protein [Oligoflexia bacterium]
MTDAQWLKQYFSDDANHRAMKWLKKLEDLKSDSSVRKTVDEFHSCIKTPLAVSMNIFETLGPKKQKLLQIQKKPKAANEDQTQIYGQNNKTLAAPDATAVKSEKASKAGQLH